MISKITVVYSLMVFACVSATPSSWHGRCTGRELTAFQNQAFLQIDQIESKWVVLISESDQEHFLRRACLAPNVEEGTVFRYGLPDKNTEVELKRSICASLYRLSTVSPEWCLDLRAARLP